MRPKSCDIPQIQTQLTLIRWHLDATAHASADLVRHKLEQAWEICETVGRALSRLDLSEQERESFERELSALRSRLATAGDAGIDTLNDC